MLASQGPPFITSTSLLRHARQRSRRAAGGYPSKLGRIRSSDYSVVTANDAAAQDKYLSMGGSGSVQYSFTAPAGYTGLYRLRLSSRNTTSGTTNDDYVNYMVGDGAQWRTAGPVGCCGSAWGISGERNAYVYLTAGAATTLSLAVPGALAGFALDAFALDRISATSVFVQGEAGTGLSGTASVVTDTGNALGNQYISFSHGGTASYTVCVPQAGTYRLVASAKPVSASTDQVYIKFGAGSQTLSSAVAPFVSTYSTSWRWAQLKGNVSLPKGNITIEFSTAGDPINITNDFDMDAFFLELQ